jgi:hypothetical protein
MVCERVALSATPGQLYAGAVRLRIALIFTAVGPERHID